MRELDASNNFNNIIVSMEDGTEREDNVNSTAQELNRFEGWECWAGIQQISTNTGDVYPTSKVGGKIGNIYEGTFNMPKDTIICTSPLHCTDVQISKALNEHVSKLRVGK